MTRAPVAPAPRRVFFLNRFFYPDHSATAQILHDVAGALAAGDRRVSVITSRLSYDGQHGYAPFERVGDIETRRVFTTRFGRATLPGRALDYISFYVSASLALFAVLRRGDLVIVKTDPPLLSVPIGLVARLRGALLINWFQDLYPEVAIGLGVLAPSGPMSRLLRWARNRSLKRARINVAIGEVMAASIEAEGGDPARIVTIGNFSDDETIFPDREAALDLRARWGFKADDFIIGYSGNLGRAHDIDTVLDAATRLQSNASVKFLFVGGGHLHDRLVAEIALRGLTNVELRPYQPRSELRASLNVPDVHWASLLARLEGTIVPSKVYGIAAAGRPIVFVGDAEGEIGRLIRQYGLGSVVAPGHGEALASELISYKDRPDKLASAGIASRAYIDTEASRALAIARWQSLLSSLDRSDLQ